jgi:hypothetical protein
MHHAPFLPEEDCCVEKYTTEELDYTAPKVEQVLSAEELDREVHYAGTNVTIIVPRD